MAVKLLFVFVTLQTSTALVESILALAMQKEALKYPTDKLDISIGYLRRVHFVTFYGAKRYRDEAHMLSMAPSVGTVPFLLYVCMYSMNVQYVLAFFR